MPLEAQNNPFNSILMVEQADETAPTGDALPDPGQGRLVLGPGLVLYVLDDAGVATPLGGGGGASDLDALLALSGGQDVSDALTGAAAPDAVNPFATMADVGGGGGGGLLAVRSYTAGSDGFISMGSGTAQDIDATNFSITFTAPASGNVLVRVGVGLQVNTAGVHGRIGLRESTTNIYAPYNVIVSLGAPQWFLPSFYLTGVSAGSHTYKASWNSDNTVYAFNGPSYGPYFMEVWEAP